MNNNYIFLLIVVWFTQLQCMEQAGRRNSVSQNQAASENKLYIIVPQGVYWTTLHPTALVLGTEDKNNTKKIRIIKPEDYKYDTVPKTNLFECDARLIKLYILKLLNYQLSEDRLSKYELSPCYLSKPEYFELIHVLKPTLQLPKNYDQVMQEENK